MSKQEIIPLSAQIIYMEYVREQEIVNALKKLQNADLIEMAKLIYELPDRNKPKLLRKLDRIIELSEQIDDKGYQEEEYDDLDVLTKIYDRMHTIIEHGQGLSTHDLARLEMLSQMLDDILSDEIFEDFRACATKWFEVVKSNN